MANDEATIGICRRCGSTFAGGQHTDKDCRIAALEAELVQTRLVARRCNAVEENLVRALHRACDQLADEETSSDELFKRYITEAAAEKDGGGRR